MKKIYMVAFFMAVLLVSGCATQTSGYQTIYNDDVARHVQTNYPLFDVVASVENSSNYSEVYVAEGKSLDTVTRELEGVKKPEQMSERNDNKQVLVYNDQFVILSTDEENSSNTLIELANKEFVRNNFNPSFFQGMLAMRVLDNLLNVNNWGTTRNSRCSSFPEECYGGYSASGGSFKGYQNSPTVRGGSSTVRGGGPGTGK